VSLACENQKKRERPVAKNVGRLSLGSKCFYFWANDGFDDNRFNLLLGCRFNRLMLTASFPSRGRFCHLANGIDLSWLLNIAVYVKRTI
jgi:hypothetical protein